MEIFCPKILEIVLVSIPDGCLDNVYTKYKYKDESGVFESSFRVVVNSLHEMLFGEITVVFLCNNTNKKKGIIKIKNKITCESKSVYKCFCDVYHPSYEHKADFYDKKLQPLGTVEVEIMKQEVAGPLQVDNKKSLTRTILNLIFMPEMAHMYEAFMNVFLEAQKGTFFCRISMILGLVSAEYYYSFVYGICDGEKCSSSPCESYFCPTTYHDLPRGLLSQSLNALRYSAAAFANSIVTWRLARRRNLENMKNSRRKSILEHLDIEDCDLIQDSTGDPLSISYIAFFETSQRMVVSFKGTTSGTEALHDINCEYVEFQDGYAHGGIKTLADGFISKSWEGVQEAMKSRGVKRLLLTGHSLGAAVAILVHLRFKEMGLEDTLEIETCCFGSPPVVSESIAQKAFPNITVFNFGTDLVPRLSYGSVLDLKYLSISISSIYDYITDKSLIIKNITEIRRHLLEKDYHTKLYHPGNLYHIKDFRVNDNTVYKYKKVNYLFFNELICGRKALFDHLIHKIMAAFTWSIEN